MVRRDVVQQRILLIGTVMLAVILAVMGGCSGLPKNVANCPITPTPPSDLTIVPAAAEPPPAALCGFPLEISAPGKGASVQAPVPVVAVATPPDPMYTVRVYVDNFAVLYTPSTIVNQLLWMPNGAHTIEVVAEDTAGYVATTSMQVNVVGQLPGALNLQDSPQWVSCSAVIVHTTCAAGSGRRRFDAHASSANPITGWIGREIYLGRQACVLQRTLLDSHRRRILPAAFQLTICGSTSTMAIARNRWNSM